MKSSKRSTLQIAILALSAAFGISAAAHAQATPAAIHPVSGQVGFGFSFAKPDYGYPFIKGFTAYGDVDLHQRFGVEADVHYDNLFTPADIGQKTFMIGPRVILVRRDLNEHKDFMHLYAKALGGGGLFQYQKGVYPKTGDDPYGVFALGGGIDLQVSRHMSVRAVDVEYQRWPGFSTHGLTPIVTTFGAAYRF